MENSCINRYHNLDKYAKHDEFSSHEQVKSDMSMLKSGMLGYYALQHMYECLNSGSPFPTLTDAQDQCNEVKVQEKEAKTRVEQMRSQLRDKVRIVAADYDSVDEMMTTLSEQEKDIAVANMRLSELQQRYDTMPEIEGNKVSVTEYLTAQEEKIATIQKSIEECELQMTNDEANKQKLQSDCERLLSQIATVDAQIEQVTNSD